jgi:hypothetical protein
MHIVDTPNGQVEVFLTDGQNVTLHAAFPAPPGSPLSGVLRGTHQPLQVKIHGCRRITPSVDAGVADAPLGQNRFEITGRWVNLSRATRLLLLGQSDPT